MKYKIFLVVFLFLSVISFAQEKIELNQFIQIAIEKNYDVLLAKNNLDLVNRDKKYAYGLLVPQLNATGGLTWNNSNQNVQFQDVTRNNAGQAKSNNTSGTVQLNWVLFDGTKMFATIDRFNSISAQGELLVKDQMVNTIASVMNNYYGIVRQKQQLIALREQMGVSEVRVKLAERKLEVGTGAKPELLQARVDYNTQLAQAIQQEAIIQQLKEQMTALIGNQLPAQYDVADTIVINLDLKLADISENVENSNYGLQALKMGMQVSSFSLRERRAERYPILNFVGAYNYSQTDNTLLINPYNAVYSKNNGYNYGFTVTMPILNNFARHKAVQQAHINYDRSEVLFNQQRLNINVGVRYAYVNYDNAKRVLAIEEETIVLAKENVAIALESFKRGLVTFIELRTAQQSLSDSYNRLIAARYNAKVSETELLRLKGALLINQ
jgi:outer membrane protein